MWSESKLALLALAGLVLVLASMPFIAAWIIP